MKKIGLALGGGGARGICHIAFIKALEEVGVKPAIISGTSIGAIVGGLYASGFTSTDMMDVLTDIGLRELTDLADFSPLQTHYLFKGQGVQEFLDKLISVKKFEDLEIPLKIAATDFWTKEQVVYVSGELIPAIRASMSIPGIFKPVTIDNRVLIDGGMTNPVPYDLIRNDCDILIAIDIGEKMQQRKPLEIPTIFDSVMYSFQILQDAIIETKRKQVPVDIYVTPNVGQYKILEFYKYKKILSSVEHDVFLFKKELTKVLESQSFIKKFFN